MCSRESWLASLRNHAVYQEQMTFPGLPLGQVQAQPFPAFSLVLPAQLPLGYHWVYFRATTNARRGYLPPSTQGQAGCHWSPGPTVPRLLLDLLLQLCDLGLQGRDGGLELGLDCSLHLLELAPELFVLSL